MKLSALLTTIAASVLILAGFVYTNLRVPKIAFVRSIVVLEKYHGMIEAKQLVAQNIANGKTYLDSLENQLESISNQIKDAKGAAREELLKEYELAQSKLRLDMNKIEERVSSQDDMLTTGVVNQINDKIKVYAENKGYDLVIGVTLSGNVLYGSKAKDITDEVVEFLNKDYK